VIVSESSYYYKVKRKPNKWTNELLFKSAERFKSVKQWRINDPSAYSTACARGLLKKLSKNMNKGKVDPWTKNKVLKSAKKFRHINDWSKSSEASAYHFALKNGFIDQASKHMTPLGNRYKRCVYTISIKGTKKVYIGLTGNVKRRKRDHFKTNRFKNLAKIYGWKNIIFNQISNYIFYKEAIKLEIKKEKEFRKKKFEVLNLARPGVIGGTSTKWTKNKILLSASKFKFLKDWRKNNPEAYNGALRLKIIKEVSKNMKRLWEKKWSKKSVLENAKKFKIKGDWKKKFPGAVLASRNFGIYKEATKHMKILSPRGKWTIEAILENAKKFKTQAQWRAKFSGAFDAAINRGVFKKATKHMVDGRTLRYKN
jgi:predicted GIY-YIG superfamily endonuclease